MAERSEVDLKEAIKQFLESGIVGVVFDLATVRNQT